MATTTLFSRSKVLYLGLYPNGQQIQIAFLAADNQPHFYQLPSSELARLPILLRQQFAEKISKKQKFIYTTCLPAHLLWQKHILLPHIRHHHERYRQVRLIIQQHLPIAKHLVQFDFNVTPLQHIGSPRQIDYIQIYAAKKQNISQYCQQFAPLKLNTLDFYAHALLRAFLYCDAYCNNCNHAENSAVLSETLCLYQDQQQSVLLLQCHDNLIQSYGKNQPLTALLTQFHQQNPDINITRYLIYAPIAEADALKQIIANEDNCVVIDPLQYPYFIALGCALWRSGSQTLSK